MEQLIELFNARGCISNFLYHNKVMLQLIHGPNGFKYIYLIDESGLPLKYQFKKLRSWSPHIDNDRIIFGATMESILNAYIRFDNCSKDLELLERFIVYFWTNVLNLPINNMDHEYIDNTIHISHIIRDVQRLQKISIRM